MFLLTECVVPEDIHTQHPFMASLKKFQIKVSGRESSNREITSMWGMNLFLKKTMSEKPLHIFDKLTLGMFVNSCTSASHYYIVA